MAGYPVLADAELQKKFPRQTLSIGKLTHPNYLACLNDWRKWRLTYEGGDEFKRMYLKKYSDKESEQSFADRRDLTYIPAFAKTGVEEIRKAISQRLIDITRQTSSKTYNESVLGLAGGVDRRGSTMEYFLGTEVLPELLVMGKVGIYVDNPNKKSQNYAESFKLKPYIYVYKVEQIISWMYDDDNRLKTLLLEDVYSDIDENFGLPMALTKRYRYFWYDSFGRVNCQIYDESGSPVGAPIQMDIYEIPFHMLSISSSLMTEVADYQIALMNMASSDVQFSRMANYPLYVEKYNMMAEISLMNRQVQTETDTNGVTTMTQSAGRIERLGGHTVGRRFPQGVDSPEYISPDTTSLNASMSKQEQMKAEIRTLLFLTLGNLQSNKQSADAKNVDLSQEENGLSYIGSELSIAENKICAYWHNYENNKNKFTVKYPQTYDIKTLDERIDEASKIIKLVKEVPSQTCRRELLKTVASILRGRTPEDTMEKIYREIDTIDVVVNPDQLAIDIENRLVSHELASKISGYPKGETEKADEDAVEHAAAIIEAQTPPEMMQPESTGLENPAARGVPELSANPKEDVKRDRNKNKEYKPRGKGKKPAATE